MINQVRMRSRNYWGQWFKKRNPPGNPQILGANNLYILPSGFGLMYGLLLLTLFSGAINYQMSTVFLMTFLLAIVGFISAWEAHNNLKGLAFQLISIDDTYQGTPAQIHILIKSNQKIRFGIDFCLNKQDKIRLEHIPAEGLRFILPIETTERGCFTLPRIVISSLFPFGIFRVWGYAYFNETYYVYPQALSVGFWPSPVMNQNSLKKDAPGDEEFYDLKQVENPWVQPNRIAWKIAAKGQGWYLKTMDSVEGDFWLFKLSDSPAAHLEVKLQHLSFWLQQAELNRYLYGLELPGFNSDFANGEQHLQLCLRQLALYS